MTRSAPSDDIPPAAQPRLQFRGLRVVVALLLREMSTSYGRTPGGYLWAILQPVAVIMILTLAFSVLLRKPSLGTSFVLFYATGFLILRAYQEISGAVGGAISFNKSLMAYPRVTYVDSVVARTILQVLNQVMVSVVILVGIFALQDIRVIMDFQKVLNAYLGALFLGLGVGTFNSYMSFSFPLYKTVWGILTRPLFLVSGVFYVYEDLPFFAQKILWYNPLIHLTGLIREGFYAEYKPTYISLTYVYLFSIIPLFFGFLLLRRFSKDVLYK